MRKAAVTALIEVGDQMAVSDIRVLLDDVDVWVRFHTINAIGELGIENHARYILSHLDDDQDIIRIAAAKALAKMDCREAIPRLRQLGGDKNNDVVQAAQAAMSELEGTV